MLVATIKLTAKRSKKCAWSGLVGKVLKHEKNLQYSLIAVDRPVEFWKKQKEHWSFFCPPPPPWTLDTQWWHEELIWQSKLNFIWFLHFQIFSGSGLSWTRTRWEGRNMPLFLFWLSIFFTLALFRPSYQFIQPAFCNFLGKGYFGSEPQYQLGGYFRGWLAGKIWCQTVRIVSDL